VPAGISIAVSVIGARSILTASAVAATHQSAEANKYNVSVGDLPAEIAIPSA
jgi:hypothetical protein